MTKMNQENYEAYCLRPYLNTEKYDGRSVSQDGCNEGGMYPELRGPATSDVYAWQYLNSINDAIDLNVRIKKIFGLNLVDMRREDFAIVYERRDEIFPPKNECTALNGFFNDINEKFVFVELDPRKPSLAWLCQRGRQEQISMKKYITTTRGNQEYIQNNIPVIREVDVGRCQLCHKYFLIRNERNHHLLHGIPPKYCPDCREQKKGEIRTQQINARNEMIQQGIDPDVDFEIVEDGENIVNIREKNNSRRTLTETEYNQEYCGGDCKDCCEE